MTSNQVDTVCPKCARPNPEKLDHCVYCGIVFSRFRRARSRPPRPAPASKARRMQPLGILDLGTWSKFFLGLARQLKAGIPLKTALVSAGYTKAGTALANSAITALDGGTTFVAACEAADPGWPAFVWSHLEAGERSGHLPEMLDLLSTELIARRKRILGRLFNLRTVMFAFILLGASFSLSVTGAIGVIPNEAVQEGASSVLSNLARGAGIRIVFYLTFFISIFWAFVWFQIKGKHLLTHLYPPFERLRLSLPLFSQILIGETLVRYLTLLGKMISAGLPLPLSLKLARADVDLPHWQGRFEEVHAAIERGESLSQGLARVPHIPAELLAEIRIGETTGELADGLEHYAVGLRERMERLHMTVNVGMGIALFIIGVLLTVFVLMRGMGAWIPLYERAL